MKNAFFLLLTAFITGCAFMTPTVETQSSYAIYDVKPNLGISASKIGEALKVVLQRNMSGVQISTGIPPSPLPEKTGRFKLTNPFKTSAIGALAARSGQSFETPSCEGVLLTANAQDSMRGYGEGSSFLCLPSYQGAIT